MASIPEEDTAAILPSPIHILGCPAHDEADEVAFQMLQKVLDPRLFETEVTKVGLLAAAVLSLVEQRAPTLVCIGMAPPGGFAQTRYLYKRLRARFPTLPIVVGCWGDTQDEAELLTRLRLDNLAPVGTTLTKTRQQIIQMLPPPIPPRLTLSPVWHRAHTRLSFRWYDHRDKTPHVVFLTSLVLVLHKKGRERRPMPLFGDKVQKSWSSQDEARFKRARLLSRLLDEQFRIPGTTYRVGLDGLLGFIPGIGDAAGVLLSTYILYEAIRLGLPKALLFRMIANIGIDTVGGAIPVVGDIFDMAWKTNKKNVALLHAYLASQRTS